jgi:3-dehydroquinate synthase
MTRQVTVALDERSYPIYIGSDIITTIGRKCVRHGIQKKIAVITDRTVSGLYLPQVVESLRQCGFETLTIVVPNGERQKSVGRAYAIYTELIQWNAGRDAAIIALGGGVIGDLAGFVAATYLRGVTFVQVPTTLLAQVDSSVGGKVGVNHPLGKNLIGAFYQPKFVLADVGVLNSLPQREMICGLAEVIKYGIIWDEEFFSFIEDHIAERKQMASDILTSIVARCCEIKAEVVSQDEREANLRAILNFGHTIGHALEAAAGYRRLKHGEAVILGMLAVSKIAHARGNISDRVFQRVQQMLVQIPVPKVLSPLSDSDILKAMSVDKKVRAGKIRFVLPKRIGKVFLASDVTTQEVVQGINYIRMLQTS